MGRHSLPDEPVRNAARDRPPRRRGVVVTTILVLVVAAGAGVAAQAGLLSRSGPCAGDPVRVDLVASPDIAPVLRTIADRARRDKVTTDGHCLDVQVAARESFKVAASLSDGTTDPDYQIWVPDSSLWTDRARGKGNGVPLTPAGNVASSPVTVGAVPTAAASLGWPNKKYSWAELTAATTATDKVRLGTADPARSATGLLALASIATSAQASGAGSDTQVAATAKLLAQRASDSDTQVLQTLAQDDSGTETGNPRRNEAVLLSEQAAFAHNSDGDGASNLDLFYPTDATPALDYPFNLVDDSELTTDQGRAALRFMTLLSQSAALHTLQDHGFRAADTPLKAAMVRTAGGRAPQPYASSDAPPPTDDAVQQTLGLWTITVQSARLTVVVDASGSMADPVPGRKGQSRMDVTKGSLLQALAQFTPQDEVGLWEFATKLDGAKDYRELEPTARLGESAPGGGTHRERLAAAFASLKPVPDGSTGLYDTTLAAYQKAQSTYVSGKFNALVVLTDGTNQDDHSISRGALINRLRTLADPRRPVPMIGIAVGPDADRTEVDQIAKATGGAGYEVSDPADIQAVILKAVMTVGQS
ncbi:substrate-binding and VWA domain-containing protein [Streptomyces sp. AcH 505]|uniref:substrate-binding domain-containing protein n=1 Tax=Streptomyces sp. AcH 505 TaxID=352211 RepID=UPI00099E1750